MGLQDFEIYLACSTKIIIHLVYIYDEEIIEDALEIILASYETIISKERFDYALSCVVYSAY